jgi:hypothetical protein
MPESAGHAVALLALAGAPAGAQGSAAAPTWLVGAGVANYALADVHGTGWGPEAVARRRLGTAFAIQARLIVIPSSSGFYDFGGVAADLGGGILLGSDRFDAALVAGASGLTGTDSDGSIYTAGGLHLMGQATGWVSRTIGFYGNVATRLLEGSGADYGTTSGSAGVAFRF